VRYLPFCLLSCGSQGYGAGIKAHCPFAFWLLCLLTFLPSGLLAFVDLRIFALMLCFLGALYRPSLIVTHGAMCIGVMAGPDSATTSLVLQGNVAGTRAGLRVTQAVDGLAFRAVGAIASRLLPKGTLA
jgi:hypothetical protein